MLKVFLTEYKVYSELSASKDIIMAGPNIEANSYQEAQELCAKQYPGLGIIVIGELLETFLSVEEFHRRPFEA